MAFQPHRFRRPESKRPLRRSIIIATENRQINAIIYTPDVEGTKAEADAKRARRAKIVFIILGYIV